MIGLHLRSWLGGARAAALPAGGAAACNRTFRKRLTCMSSEDAPPILVLVVDDEAVLRFIAIDVLEESGFRVLEAEDAKAALRVLADNPDVRVLFTDINMPGALDGVDLAREAHARWPEIKLVVTSGRPKPVDKDIPDESRFVPKPYSPDHLVREIRKALAK